MLIKSLLCLLTFCACSAMLAAQGVVSVCGEYSYPVPEHVPVAQAKQIALERARVEALAKKFGTAIAQHSALMRTEENEKVSEAFFSLLANEVKGEWLEDTKEPTLEVTTEQGRLTVNASVCFKAREIKGAGVDFTAKALRNGTESKYESDDFRHGDDLYLLFRSPVDGYLAVYLVDDTPTAYCLLPYRGDPSGQAQVKAGQEYVFFSERHAERGANFVDEYTPTCEKPMEQNTLYIIFSPNEFTKANDTGGE
ncbi:MAG: DUF4384 domain-containing protein [Prevotellaceae bacterium]|nr:DUF4384 domain-containing protein [Prevotellaceae bacterium]